MRGNFFMLENSIFQCDLTVFEFKIYAYLCMRANKENTCFPTASRIAEDCKISESQVRKVTASLERKGFITKKKQYQKTIKGRNRQTSNLYHIEPVPICCNEATSLTDRQPPI